MTVTMEPLLEAAHDYIYNQMDLSRIINKMVSYQGWLKKDVLLVSEQYKNFLFLKRKYGHQYRLPPSKEIDVFWHNHILDTKQYQLDCQSIFGDYLHHYPYFGMDGKSSIQEVNAAFNTMQTLYFQEFGDYLYCVRKFHMMLLIKLMQLFRKKNNTN